MSLRVMFFVVFTLLSLQVEAGTVILLGRPINTMLPTGYCEIGTHPADIELVKRTGDAIGSSNKILALFAECQELEDFRSGRRAMLDNYGQILAQTPKGQLRLLKGVSRSAFIQTISAELGDMPGVFEKAFDRLKKFDPSFRSQENLGLLGSDSNGLYMGALTRMEDATGHPRTIVGVVGMTLVKELSISINIYHAYSATLDLRGLLAHQQSVIADFVRVNN